MIKLTFVVAFVLFYALCDGVDLPTDWNEEWDYWVKLILCSLKVLLSTGQTRHSRTLLHAASVGSGLFDVEGLIELEASFSTSPGIVTCAPAPIHWLKFCQTGRNAHTATISYCALCDKSRSLEEETWREWYLLIIASNEDGERTLLSKHNRTSSALCHLQLQWHCNLPRYFLFVS